MTTKDLKACPIRAIRFAREGDAAAMLVYHLNGNGRVAEHMWVPK